MEYLFICRFISAPEKVPSTEWTDQMKRFWWEIATVQCSSFALPKVGTVEHGAFGWELADLSDVLPLGLSSIYTDRTQLLISTASVLAHEWQRAVEKHTERPPHALRALANDEPVRTWTRGPLRSRREFVELDRKISRRLDTILAIEAVVIDSASGLMWFSVTLSVPLHFDYAVNFASELSEFFGPQPN